MVVLPGDFLPQPLQRFYHQPIFFNTQLQAESGIDYEFGTRGSLLNNRFYFDINALFYKLKNAIVQRQNPTGADYFDNAGSAKQNGLETFLSYELINNEQ